MPFLLAPPLLDSVSSVLPLAQCETEQDAPPPEEPGCRHLIDDMNLEALLDDETWGKLKRFREMKENRHFRECPKCQHP